MIISDDKVMAEVFNKVFVDMVPNLKIPQNNNFETEFLETNDPVLNAIKKIENHPRIIMINNKINATESRWEFCFHLVDFNDFLKKTMNLDVPKSPPQNGIPIKPFKKNCHDSAYYFCDNIHYYLENSKFPSKE